jgi:hypothetical protein
MKFSSLNFLIVLGRAVLEAPVWDAALDSKRAHTNTSNTYLPTLIWGAPVEMLYVLMNSYYLRNRYLEN